MNGDTLDEAIFNANAAVEEKLGVDLDFFSADSTTSETGDVFNKMMLANDTTYDLWHLVQWNASKFAAEGMYYNMYGAPYVSYGQPWWDYAYMKEMTIGSEKIFMLSGDFAVDRTRCLGCVYYNKALFANYFENADGLYQEVLDHKWTFDRMREVSTEVYSDLNNNGQVDREDQIGYCINNYNNLDILFTASAARVTERDNDDVPYLVLNNQRSSSVCQAVYDMVFDTEGVYFSGSAYEEDVANRTMFEQGSSMFLIGFFYTSEAMREMKNDFGIVPLPMYDENQKDYVSDAHDIIRLYGVPYNCQKVEAVSAVLEELAFQGYQNVMPQYYEVLMKNKYARDDISAKMIDLIRDNCRPDIAHIYNEPFNSLGYLCRKMVQEKSAFASTYASYEAGALTAMEKFIDSYTSVED